MSTEKFLWTKPIYLYFLLMEALRTYQFNNSTVKLLFGDMLNSEAQVIVSSDDGWLSMGGGLSRQIHVAGGPTVRADAEKQVPATLGDVVVTSAGALSQRFVFHAVTIDCFKQLPSDDEKRKLEIEEYIISHSVERSLRLLIELGLHSIAFPVIGAGAACIPRPVVARSMAAAFRRVLSATNKTIAVELWFYSGFRGMTQTDAIPFFEHMASEQMLAAMNRRQPIDAGASVPKVDVEVKQATEDVHSHQVFISYSRADGDEAKRICGLLNEMGVNYWIDVDGTYSGENYKGVIYDAIMASKLVVFISSEHSNASANVAKEISLADKGGKVIIPVRIDNAPYSPNISYDLCSVDAVELFNDFPTGIDKLRRVVQGRLAISSRPHANGGNSKG